MIDIDWSRPWCMVVVFFFLPLLMHFFFENIPLRIWISIPIGHGMVSRYMVSKLSDTWQHYFRVTSRTYGRTAKGHYDIIDRKSERVSTNLYREWRIRSEKKRREVKGVITIVQMRAHATITQFLCLSESAVLIKHLFKLENYLRQVNE